MSSPGIYCPNGAAGGCVQDLPFDWQALTLGAAKLPIRTKFVQRIGEG